MKKFYLVLAVLALTLVLGGLSGYHHGPHHDDRSHDQHPDSALYAAFDPGHPALYPAFGDPFPAQRQLCHQWHRRHGRHGWHGRPGGCKHCGRHRRKVEPDAITPGAVAPVHITR